MAGDYQRMWETARGSLAKGLIDVDPVPTDGGTRWGISLILRPTQDVTGALLAEVERLRDYVGSGHIFYGPDNLHTTVRSIEGYRAWVPKDDRRVVAYTHVAKQLAREFLPLTIDYCGLTATRGSILAQGWPNGDDLQRLRHHFHDALAERSLLTSGPELQRPRRTAHATLVLFSKAIARPVELVAHVEASRATQYGRSTLDELSIVRYWRMEASVTMETLVVMRA